MAITRNIKNIFEEHQNIINLLYSFIPMIEKTSQKIIDVLKNNGTIFWMGNGGSAADAQHMAAELIGRFKKERKALASLSLTTDTSVLTSLSNDYDFNIIFQRQLEALCKPNDVVIALSTSGNSKNILLGITEAKKIGAYTIGFTGQNGGALKDLVENCFMIPSETTARIQEATTLLCHSLCELVEQGF